MRTISTWLPVAGVCLAVAGIGHAGSRNAARSVKHLVQAGTADWKASCPSGGDMCVRSRTFRHRLRCTGSMERYWVVKRSSRADRGLKKLARAVKAYRSAGGSASRELARAAAPAFLLTATADHERFLRTQFPRRLTFDPRDSIGRSMSVIRFRRWVTQLTSNVSRLVSAYRETAAVAKRAGNVELRRLAIERTAQVFDRAASLIRSARIPRSMAKAKKYSREMTAAYCDEMGKQAAPLVRSAKRLRAKLGRPRR